MATPYTQDLLDRATAYVALPLSGRRYAEGLADITQLYAEITGQPASTCRQCQYSNYLAVVTAYIGEATRFLHPDTVKNTTYTIAPQFAGEQFVHPDYGKVVTAENLTDEDAEFFRKHGRSDAFLLKSEVGKPAAADSTLAVTPESPLVPQADLETEQRAHVATKELLDDAIQRNTGLDEAFGKESDARFEAEKALTKELEAHKVTKETLKSARKAEGVAIKARDEAVDKLAQATAQIAELQHQLNPPAAPDAPAAE